MDKCIIVLDMHKSSTSTLTGVLNILGVNVSSKKPETTAVILRLHNAKRNNKTLRKI